MSQTQAMREELSSLYAQTSTEELLDRYQPGMLTEIAAEVMKQELIKRGVTPPVFETHDDKSIETESATTETGQQIGDWINLAAGLTATDAHILRARLEAEGIPALVGDEHVAQSMWLYGLAISSAKVRVPASLEKEAREVMQALARGDFDINEAEDTQKSEASEATPPPRIIRAEDHDAHHNPYAPPREFRDQDYYEETDEFGTVQEVLSPQNRQQQLYAAFAQDKYYPARWEAGISWMSFNLSAFLFGFIWCFFRKLYAVGIIVLAAEVLVLYLVGTLYFLPGNGIPLFNFLARIMLIRLPLSIMANGLYGQYAEKQISALSARHPQDADLLKALHKAGGISVGGTLIGVVLVYIVSLVPLR